MILHREGDQRLEYHENFVDSSLYLWCENQVHWEQRQIAMFGKRIPEPRLTAWYGPAYAYSGIERTATPLPDRLALICEQLTSEHQFDFNSVLLNLYRNGQDSMGWHRDNEPELDTLLIASISLGAERRFLLRRKTDGSRVEIIPSSGSLTLMYNLQQEWEHSVPKTSRDMSPRINLTFRRINHR